MTNEGPTKSKPTPSEARLQAVREEIEGWDDRLGQGVDEGIKDTVAIFNVIGMPTSASCEGHFQEGGDHGYPAPWIEIHAPPQKMEALLQEFYTDRAVPDEVRLVLDAQADGFRVHNGGKFYIPNYRKERLQNELTEEERARIPEVLEAAQQEMRAFTEFLKKKYIEEVLV